MTEVTELLLPVRRPRIVRLRSSGGGMLELAGIGGALLLLLATMYVGGAGPQSQATTASILHAQPAAALPQVAAAPITVAAPATVVVAPAAVAPPAPAGTTPNVVGVARDAAATALLAAGYRSISWVSESSQARGPGTVLRQEPAAGSLVQSREARLVIAR